MAATAPKPAGILKKILAPVAILYLLVYVVIACLRLRYPFELEWMEGGSVDHVRRILDGKGLYVEPGIDFVPYIYTPLYFYVSAALARVIGIGFLPLRIVSFVSSLGCLLLIAGWVRRETDSRLFGLLAAGLFAATFRAGGAWLDIARVDSLCLLLFLAGACLLRFAASPGGTGAAGLLLALSFLTKQTALVMAAPLVVATFHRSRRSGLLLLGTLGDRKSVV